MTLENKNLYDMKKRKKIIQTLRCQQYDSHIRKMILTFNLESL